MVWSFVLSALAGIALWTFAEYWLHRVLGHDVRTRPNPFATEHVRHHSEGDYFAPGWKKALVTLAAVPAVAVLAALLVGPALGLTFGVAFVSMYVLYEVVHRRAHTHRGVGAWGRYLRRHHFHHHFGDPHKNHGVTSPLWDLVFGTYERPTRIRVPAKLPVRWLLDPSTGAVRDEFAPHYELQRQAA